MRRPLGSARRPARDAAVMPWCGPRMPLVTNEGGLAFKRLLAISASCDRSNAAAGLISSSICRPLTTTPCQASRIALTAIALGRATRAGQRDGGRAFRKAIASAAP